MAGGLGGMIGYDGMQGLGDAQNGDWWAQNAPSDTATSQGTGQPTGPQLQPQGASSGPVDLSQVNPSNGWIQGWQPNTNATNAGITVDPSKANDPNYILSVLRQTAQASGNPFDEQAARTYWLPKIQQSGGLSDYWVTRALPDQYGGGALMGKGGASGGGAGGFGSLNFSAPSLEDARNSPGYQFAQQQGQQAIQNSAASRGTLLTGGTLKSLASYGTGLADQTYGQAFGRALQTNQANFGNLYNVAALGKPS